MGLDALQILYIGYNPFQKISIVEKEFIEQMGIDVYTRWTTSSEFDINKIDIDYTVRDEFQNSGCNQFQCKGHMN